jgi:ABC-2 type transport system permease protein
LIQKDLTLFFRNRFYTLITLVALIAYTGVYYLMPDSVAETIEVGLYAPSTSSEVTKMLAEDGVSFQLFESPEALQQAILDEDIGSGLAFPDNPIQEVTAGTRPTVEIYVPSDIDQDTQEALRVIVEAMSLTLTGRSLDIEAGVPSVGVLFPGMLTGWAKLIPSYYLADTLHQVINFGAGWPQITHNLLRLLVWDVVLLWVGATVLKRKFA